MSKAKIHSIHPGEILLEEFMRPLGLSQYRIAKDIGVPPIRIHEIINWKRSITPLTALRLSKYLRTTAQFWLNLQSHYDLEVEKAKSMARINKEVKPLIKNNRT
jgi:addiction module HigA family antidote